MGSEMCIRDSRGVVCDVARWPGGESRCAATACGGALVHDRLLGRGRSVRRGRRDLRAARPERQTPRHRGRRGSRDGALSRRIATAAVNERGPATEFLGGRAVPVAAPGPPPPPPAESRGRVRFLTLCAAGAKVPRNFAPPGGPSAGFCGLAVEFAVESGHRSTPRSSPRPVQTHRPVSYTHLTLPTIYSV